MVPVGTFYCIVYIWRILYVQYLAKVYAYGAVTYILETSLTYLCNGFLRRTDTRGCEK